DTAGAVRRLQAEIGGLDLLVRPGKLGFGTAYTDGFRRALADSSIDGVLMMDGDLSHDPHAVPEMVDELAGCDVVIGSRYIKDGRLRGWP
ncbi:MAG TPA: glycosyltransferase, partial [Bryobacteraceae bacterium]